ncbi:MAG TPA: ABC transporter ATP-binding protein [Gammaproteobacteria bacterium]|nr:ABC transporter ATP-binding protein [Gammaproteobacteria bacterium]
MSAALSFSAVTKTFPGRGQQVTALNAVSLSIQPGQVTGLIGPDGAGKTTLLRLAASLLEPDRGDIWVMDHEVPGAVAQQAIGYMPQRFGLYEDLSVQENLDLYADLQGVLPEQRSARYAELMQMMGMTPFLGRLAGKLSGGMKQKLGLACALLRSPSLLLLDEPTVGVDPVSRRELWHIVYRQVADEGMSVLLSTAYLDEAERCDEVILLHEGELLGQGNPYAFSQSMVGRIFGVTAEGVPARRLQAELSRVPSVLDALIEGETVRVVMASAQVPSGEMLQPERKHVEISVLKPRFEDAFVARLKPASVVGLDKAEINPDYQFEKTDEVIRVHELERRFGDFVAVDRVSFSVRRGEIFGLLGANGAGKSTTFRMLCGLLPVTRGEVSVAGYDLRRASANARRRIGYMAQKFSLYGDLSVMQNLRFFSSVYGLHGQRQRERLEWALETFELSPYAAFNAADLALGYKQRLAFATALMHSPEILFLDEPTSGVDPLARREFWARTNALAEAGVTVLVTTHFMEEANYCDRVVIMADGAVLAEGTPQAMKTLARTAEQPEPNMEEAFIYLITHRQKPGGE